MNDELTIDMAMPESKPVRFTFQDKYPDLHFQIKTEYSIKEAKRIQWLGRTWSQYFNMPDSKLREADHRNAERSMTDLMRLCCEQLDEDAFNALPEFYRMRVINKVYEVLGEVLSDGSDKDEDGAANSPNDLDWGSNSPSQQAPLAEVSSIG